jgi:hypothetical protein
LLENQQNNYDESLQHHHITKIISNIHYKIRALPSWPAKEILSEA